MSDDSAYIQPSDRDAIGCPCCGKPPGRLEDDCTCNRIGNEVRRQRDLIRRLAEALAIEGDSECGTKEEVCILLAEARGIEATNE